MSGLELSGFSVDRAGFNIVRDVTMRVPKREVTVLIGPNGAGKTTLLEGIMGVIPAKGRLTIDGQSLAQKRIEARAAAGLSLVEQGRTIFADLTVQENLEIVADDPPSWPMSTRSFPSWSNDATALRYCCQAGNSRCWSSDAR